MTGASRCSRRLAYVSGSESRAPAVSRMLRQHSRVVAIDGVRAASRPSSGRPSRRSRITHSRARSPATTRRKTGQDSAVRTRRWRYACRHAQPLGPLSTSGDPTRHVVFGRRRPSSPRSDDDVDMERDCAVHVGRTATSPDCRSGAGAWRPARSSRSGGWRPGPRRYRRGSTRGTGSGRASAGRCGTSRGGR
jgi:hypothetical protein